MARKTPGPLREGPPLQQCSFFKRTRIPSVRRQRISIAIASILLILAARAAEAQSRKTLDAMEAYNRGDIAAAFQGLSEEADAGDSEAQVNLGYMYARGQGVPPDQQMAFKLYGFSAAQGNGEGMNALGYKFEHGTGIPRDIATAVHWYCNAVRAGNPRGMNNLAILLSNGNGVPRDREQARDLWRQSASLGHANAMANLAFSLLQGNGERDREQGLFWMRQAAVNGHRRAQTFMRSIGYGRQLPRPSDEAARMIPAIRGKAGHARICGDLIS